MAAAVTTHNEAAEVRDVKKHAQNRQNHENGRVFRDF